MKLRISEITLRNFKAFKKISIHPNHDFNIIIGENSTGKSTIFEAIQLWEKCYRNYILSSRKGFYKLSQSTSRYVNYQDLDFLRIANDEDLFHDPKDPELGKCAELTIALTNDADAPQTWSLGFTVTCPTSIENAFYRVQPIDYDQFVEFAASFCQPGKFLDEAIFIYQTRPISGVSQFEPYYNEAQIKKKIKTGHSHEVLRNKIISKRNSLVDLERRLSEIIEKSVKFSIPPATRREKDEFIQLEVRIGSDAKVYDLHLQGSGFLQIVEILATIEYIDAPLKVLLVDEPDSHIHSKLQKNLLSHLRRIDHNQFFIISHNDQFVTNAGNGEIFFLNDDAKTSGELKPVDSRNFDVIKKALGGVILSLERLNQSDKIVFIEGEDDADYLNNIFDKIKCIAHVSGCLSKVTFFPLRGKDNILQKIEYNKRTLSALLRGKRLYAIFDRDFSNNIVDETLKRNITGKGCTPYSHVGYCIESVVFSDTVILKKYVCTLVPHIPQATINLRIDELLGNLGRAITDVNDPKNIAVQRRFDGQKNNRPEFDGLNFADVMRSWNDNGVFRPERVMSKPIICEFILDLENKIGVSLFLRTSNNEEEISSKFFLNYIKSVQMAEDLIPSLVQLLEMLDVRIIPGVEQPLQVERQ
ncbi:ATP-dependent endonuclease [Chitinibacter tainanensis]|uniref:ATP-dependent nuclease n=1 Tax=Chitinibacter tainanensis TaxID=230667 RepID=UPI002356BDD9|nr:AAA family ATPase [Chitinibacter tainanensis]